MTQSDSGSLTHLLKVAKVTTRMYNTTESLYRALEAAILRFGARAVEKWLMDPSSRGKGVIEMMDELRSQKNRKSIARADAKRNTRANPSSCALCLGTGSVKTGMIQGYGGPEEVWGSCPDCRG